MIQINFSEEEIEQLNYERYHYPHPLVQKRMEALYLKSQKLPHQQICQIYRISKTTLIVYLKKYQEGGKEALKKLGYTLNGLELNFLKRPKIFIRCGFQPFFREVHLLAV